MSDIDDDDDNGKQEVDESWLGTFSDISLLLLTFFILLCSMSTIEVVKFKSVFGSMREAFGGIQTEDLTSGGSHEASKDESQQEEQSIQQFLRVLSGVRITKSAVSSPQRDWKERSALFSTKGSSP